MKRTALWIIFLLIFVVCCASLSACNFHIHAYGEWTVVKAANCTQDGQQERYCSCGEKQTVTINATGHTFDDWTVIKQASCSEVGQQERTCSCGEKESATIPVLPHTFGAWTTVRESTCTQKGKEERVCSCGEKETRDIAFAAHPYTSVVTGPTCTEQGYTTHTCGNCGHSYIDTYVDAIGHSFSEWITDTEATCTQEGSKHRVCSTCRNSEAETIPVKDHAYGEWTVVRESTCTQKGQEERVCGCGAKETKDIDLADHTKEILPAVDATCAATGLTEGSRCSVCGATITAQQIVDALDHSFTNYVSDNNATCTADGTKTAKCDRCDETDTINDVGSAKGHAYSDEWSMDDTYHWHAAICGHSSEMGDRAEHDWDEGVVTVEPTETTEGEKICTCEVCGRTKTVILGIVIRTYTVTFKMPNGTVIEEQTVNHGDNAVAPLLKDTENFPRLYFDFENIKVYYFSGWSDSFDNITEDKVGDKAIVAQYTVPYDQPVIFVKQDGNTLIIQMYCYADYYIYGIEFAFDWKEISYGKISECEYYDDLGSEENAEYYNHEKTFKYMFYDGYGKKSPESNYFDIGKITFSEANGVVLSVDKINFSSCTVIYGPSDANVEDLLKITPIIKVIVVE